MLTLDKISSLETFKALGDEWQALLAHCPHRTPFLTHEWMMLWWKYFGTGKELCILVAREYGRAVAIAPLTLHWGWLTNGYPKVPLRVIESMANHHSNRTDFIFANFKDEYLTLFWNFLLNEERWHGFRLAPLLSGSPTVEGLRTLINRERLYSTLTMLGSSPYLPMPDDWAGYCSQRSRSLRNKMRKGERLLAEGKISVELTDDVGRLDTTLAQLFEISGKGWAARMDSALSSTAQLRGFYSELARLAAERRWLFVQTLKIADRPTAYNFDLLYEHTLYSLKSAFDPEFARWNPGSTLTCLALTDIARHRPDIREYDFLGDAEPYKLQWTPNVRPLTKLFVYHPRNRYAQSLRLLQSRLLTPIKERLSRRRRPALPTLT